jgi:hypothetical protein
VAACMSRIDADTVATTMWELLRTPASIHPGACTYNEIGRLAGSWINPAKGIPPQAAKSPLLRVPTSIHLELPWFFRQIP